VVLGRPPQATLVRSPERIPPSTFPPCIHDIISSQRTPKLMVFGMTQVFSFPKIIASVLPVKVGITPPSSFPQSLLSRFFPFFHFSGPASPGACSAQNRTSTHRDTVVVGVSGLLFRSRCVRNLFVEDGQLHRHPFTYQIGPILFASFRLHGGPLWSQHYPCSIFTPSSLCVFLSDIVAHGKARSQPARIPPI